MIVASFWVYRPEEHPNAADYPAMLRILQRSCDRLGLRHVVLTDDATADSDRWPVECVPWPGRNIPAPLMNACTEVQAQYLEDAGDLGSPVAFVGADCIMLKWPVFNFVPMPDLCVTYRHAAANYPINTGLQYVNTPAKVAPVFRRIANRCGVKWCDDQRALIAELEPMPSGPGLYERAGIRVGFLPMRPYNVLPKSVDDPARDAVMLHFRGKQHSSGLNRKDMLFAWAAKHGV